MISALGMVSGNINQPGWEIHLCPGNSTTVLAKTNALTNGKFAFTNVQPGSYVVRAVIQSGFNQTSPTTPSTNPPGLPGGNHISVTAGVETQDVNFSVLAVSPISQAIVGWNVSATWPVSIVVPAMGKTGKAGKIARYFPGNGFAVSSIPAILAYAQQLAAWGIQSFIVLNFGDNQGLIPSNWNQFIDALAQAITGKSYIYGFAIGNEIDSASYFKDTPANYVKAFNYAVQKLKPLTRVVLGNICTWGPNSAGQNWYTAINAIDSTTFKNASGAGLHAYEDDPDKAIADHISCSSWLASLGCAYFCDELGLHMNSQQPNTWAAAIGKLITWCLTQSATWLIFALMPTGTTAGFEAPFTAKGLNNEPFFSAEILQLQ